jgi:hypothetical protein
MSRRRRRPVQATLALLLVAGLGVVVLGGFSHTDDGCAVETHCLACRQALGSIAIVNPTVPVLPVLPHLADVVTPAAIPATARALIRREPSRGPPQA